MFMENYIKTTSNLNGIPHVLHGLNEICGALTLEFQCNSAYRKTEKEYSITCNTFELNKKLEDIGFDQSIFYKEKNLLISWYAIDSIFDLEFVDNNALHTSSTSLRVDCLILPKSGIRSDSNWCVQLCSEVVFTVKSLHAGTLVIQWTTAPSTPLFQSRKAQLAPFLFLCLTITIATRCYASTKATYIQSNQLQTLNPIRNSKIQFSNIFSKLIQSHFVQKRNVSPLKTLLYQKRVKRVLCKQNFNISEEDIIPKLTKRVPLQIANVKRRSHFNNILEQKSDSNENETDVGEKSRNSEKFGNVSVANNFSRVISQKLNYSNNFHKQISSGNTQWPMPPVNGSSFNSSVDRWGIVSIITLSITVVVTLGLITCILSHYRTGTIPEGGGTASDPNNAALTPTPAPMLSVVSAGATAGVGGMERLRGGRVAARDIIATRERQVRLHALRTDFAVNLPPSITLPDGEDHPYSNTRLHIRDAEQEAEIYQKCIRPPPNRTVLESESPPPYRSSSAGLLGSSSSSSSSADWSASGGASNAPLVVRCHSMSSTSKRTETGIGGQKTDFLQRTVKIFTGKKTAPQAPGPAPTLPAVVVPSGSRRRFPDQNAAAPTSQRPSKGGV